MAKVNSKSFFVEDNTGVVLVGDMFDVAKFEEGAYSVTEFPASTINATAGMQWYVKTGAATCYLAYETVTNQDCKVTLHESITVTATNTGSLLTAFNRDRNSSVTASTAIYGSGTLTASGTIIDTTFKNLYDTGRKARGAQEWLLKVNTDYMLWVDPLTASAYVTINFSFSEDL